ncbi:MAG: penicillin-binding protein 2 [Acidimicrobiia bacterium]
MNTTNTRLRLSIVGVVAIALFSALFTRLWFMQVASGGAYAAAAQSNRVREVQTEAPRGRILDRQGRVLVDNRIERVVTMERRLTTAQRVVTAQRLAALLNTTADDVLKRLNDPRLSPYKAVPIATDVPLETVQYIKEHQDELRGVNAVSLPVRRYLYGTTAAHVLGYAGELNDDEYARLNDAGYQLGDTVGKSGIEQSYESDLRGKPGVERVEVDSAGKVVRTIGSEEAVRGNDVMLTLDLDVQRVTEESLAQGLSAASSTRDVADKAKWSQFKAPGGAVVVLDAKDGSVVAMASSPTYDPAEFANGIPSETWKRLNDPANHYPLTNRAIQGQYAPGSTFKLVTALAGLESGLITPDLTIVDTGSLVVADRQFNNAGNEAHGPVNLARAMTVSSDVYFYRIGAELWKASNRGAGNGELIQDVSRRMGFGSSTGIELAGETKGRIPDSKWKQAVHKERPDAFPYGQWLPGDNVNLSIGQGDTLVTPLQLGQSYVMFANGGTRYQPRVVSKVVSSDGKASRDILPMVRSQMTFSPDGRAALSAGFEGAVANPSGTAVDAFAGFPLRKISVAGKTGTAQVTGKQDTSLFVAYEPANNPKYVIAAVLEESGYGAAVAAPVVRRIIEAMNALPTRNVSYSQGVGRLD